MTRKQRPKEELRLSLRTYSHMVAELPPMYWPVIKNSSEVQHIQVWNQVLHLYHAVSLSSFPGTWHGRFQWSGMIINSRTGGQDKPASTSHDRVYGRHSQLIPECFQLHPRSALDCSPVTILVVCWSFQQNGTEVQKCEAAYLRTQLENVSQH